MRIVAFNCFILLGSGILAQTEQKDIVDVVVEMFHKTPAVHVPDSLKIKPGKAYYAFLPGFGYKQVTSLTAVAPVNISFYLGKSSDTYISSISISPQYSFAYQQIVVPVVSNIWSKENKYNLLGDVRYYQYPSYTYGLGGHTTLSDVDQVSYSYIRVYQEVLKHIRSDFYAGMGYNLDYHYNIMDQGAAQFEAYDGGATKTISSGLVIHLLFDARKNINNPPRGYYASIIYRSNFTFLGSDRNWQSAVLDFRKYFKLSANSDNILAFWSYNWFTFGGHVPYFDMPSTGWDTYSDMGREYIQGRLRGSDLLYLESEYRFPITRNGLLGGVVFANAESVSDYPSNKFETIFPGAGVGLRLKINTFSRANYGIDYGFGNEGSQGLFFHLCEVF
jgi:outer membrane protein assembly factor BamA